MLAGRPSIAWNQSARESFDGESSMILLEFRRTVSEAAECDICYFLDNSAFKWQEEERGKRKENLGVQSTSLVYVQTSWQTREPSQSWNYSANTPYRPRNKVFFAEFSRAIIPHIAGSVNGSTTEGIGNYIPFAILGFFVKQDNRITGDS